MSTIFKQVGKHAGTDKYHASVVHNGARQSRSFNSRTNAISWINEMEIRLLKIRLDDFRRHARMGEVL